LARPISRYVAGRNKIEYYFSDRLSEARTKYVAGRNKIEYYFSAIQRRALYNC